MLSERFRMQKERKQKVETKPERCKKEPSRVAECSKRDGGRSHYLQVEVEAFAVTNSAKEKEI